MYSKCSAIKTLNRISISLQGTLTLNQGNTGSVDNRRLRHKDQHHSLFASERSAHVFSPSDFICGECGETRCVKAPNFENSEEAKIARASGTVSNPVGAALSLSYHHVRLLVSLKKPSVFPRKGDIRSSRKCIEMNLANAKVSNA